MTAQYPAFPAKMKTLSMLVKKSQEIAIKPLRSAPTLMKTKASLKYPVANKMLYHGH